MLVESITTVSNEIFEKTGILPSDADAEQYCQVSGTKGLRVLTNTLRGHVFEKYWDIINDKKYFFCPNKDCNIVYFNNTDHYYFSTTDVKTKVSHKIGEEPRPICYCLNVLEHKIIDEIVVKQCCTSLEDIKKYTGARTGKLCHITNPSGRCCGPQVNEIISKGIQLLSKEKESVELVLEQIHNGCEYCKHEIEFISPSFDILEDTCKSCNIKWEKPRN
ncbi:MAG: (2Fe-2S)-binding protein [Candidatus Hodarchaeales archaeon]